MSSNLPGVAIAIISESQVQYMKTFGFSGRAVFDENTLFKVGSLSKTFTAWGVMTLVQKGLIQLDDPIQKHMHSYTLPPPYNPGWSNEGVTIRRLLAHTSGIISLGIMPYNPVEGVPLPTTSQLLKKDNVRLVIDPNKEIFMYSSHGYILLQMMIEDVTNQSFGDYVQEQVLKPLGMNVATYKFETDVNDPNSNYSVGYTVYRAPMPLFVPLERGSGGIYLPIVDAVKMPLTFMRKEQTILNESLIQEMLTPVSVVRENPFRNLSVGLGLWMTQNREGPVSYYHGGDIHGFKAHYEWTLNGSGIVILTNCQQGGNFYTHILCYWSRMIWQTRDVCTAENNDLWIGLGIVLSLISLFVWFGVSLFVLIPRINCLELSLPLLDGSLSSKKRCICVTGYTIRAVIALFLLLLYIVLMVVLYSDSVMLQLIGAPYWVLAYMAVEYTFPYFTLGLTWLFMSGIFISLFIYSKKRSHEIVADYQKSETSQELREP
ncbi:hypothetical protein C9374_014342 [Naegleria lovaniensis]|uniref:Beta-lactamase-related domain-containing protein n=1 Tax=Naegleria lovaniensis TaxID=51637 RepID=A0AA88GU55_NAELO|nr:uncharacterized protein C9374_014342 [Naegleria lovaniensis]KAG2388942.1 hypothetical protein C9374_014342 [Naegleria lovaniensis]